jgi:hypothetical protein
MPNVLRTAAPTRRPSGGADVAEAQKTADATDSPSAKGWWRSRMPPRSAWWTFLALLSINHVLMRSLFPDADAPVTVPYTVFKQQVAQGNVGAIYSQGVSIEGRFTKPVPWPPAEGDASAPRRGAHSALPRLLPRAASSRPPRSRATWSRAGA